MRIYFILLIYFISVKIIAQVPGYEIYLLYIGGNEDSGYVYSEPMNISNFIGYDNQPSFTQDSKGILFTSLRNNDQTDIYYYSIESNSLKQITDTKESEYSPEVTPDNKYFTVVRVEQDSSQRIWKFKSDGSKPKLVLKFIFDVGYYCRLDKDRIVFFQLPEPFTLKIASIGTQGSKYIDQSIGRSIKKIPNENAFIYLKKDFEEEWTIMKCDERNRTNEISTILSGAEDFAFYTDQNLFMARGPVIYYFDYNETKTWYKFADLSQFEIDQIFRIAFSPDGKWMTFVTNEAMN